MTEPSEPFGKQKKISRQRRPSLEPTGVTARQPAVPPPDPVDLPASPDDIATTVPIAEPATHEIAVEQANEIQTMLQELLTAVPAETRATAEAAREMRTNLLKRRLHSVAAKEKHNTAVRAVLDALQLTGDDYEIARTVITVPVTEFPEALQEKWQRIRTQMIDPIDRNLANMVSELHDFFPDPRQHRADLYAISYDYAAAVRGLDAKRDGGRDSLTGLVSNRGFMDEMFEVQLKLLALLEESRAMAVVRIDLDGFKHLNDKYGHTAGDKALKDFAAALQQQFRRSSDVLSISARSWLLEEDDIAHTQENLRIGGDEFSLVVNDIDLQQHPGIEADSVYENFPNDYFENEVVGHLVLMAVVHRIRQAASTVTLPDGGPLSISVGFFRIHKQEAIQMLYGTDPNYNRRDFIYVDNLADQAAQRAKDWGDGVTVEYAPNAAPVPVTVERAFKKALKGFRRDHSAVELTPEIEGQLMELAKLIAAAYEAQKSKS